MWLSSTFCAMSLLAIVIENVISQELLSHIIIIIILSSSFSIIFNEFCCTIITSVVIMILFSFHHGIAIDKMKVASETDIQQYGSWNGNSNKKLYHVYYQNVYIMYECDINFWFLFMTFLFIRLTDWGPHSNFIPSWSEASSALLCEVLIRWAIKRRQFSFDPRSTVKGIEFAPLT